MRASTHVCGADVRGRGRRKKVGIERGATRGSVAKGSQANTYLGELLVLGAKPRRRGKGRRVRLPGSSTESTIREIEVSTRS